MNDFFQISGNTVRIGFFSMTFTLSGILEILIFAVLAYYIIMWFKRSKAWNLLKGLGLLLAVYLIATLLKLDSLAFIFEKLFSSIVLAVIIIFQPEIRRGLEQIGTKNIFRELIPNVNAGTLVGGLTEKSVTEIVNALTYMGRNKVGALIVVERDNPLDDIIETGINLDAEISTALLEQIFEKNTPLHDGAVVIRNNRVTSATCLLPISQNMDISKELGTRHRAGLGMSEASDCVTLIASEETGALSIASGGELKRNASADDIREALGMTLKEGEPETEKKTSLLNRLRKGADNHAGEN